MVGKSIENYRIDEVLGHGGMGVVYRAMDTSIDRTVALKVMNPSFAADPEFLWRFKSEAKVLGRLLHPNIVNVYAFRHIESHLFIVMEYVDGGTLSSYITNKGIVPYQDAIPILKQCLTALEIAHKASIIHRDIKPQNILLTKDGQIKISDFGLAKIQENTSTSVTRVGVTGGTIYYMPPEQSVALSEVDHRGDIYSLGMTMYQMLAGRMPFNEGSSTLTILKAIDEQKIPAPDTFNPLVPPGMADIVMRAIEKDRDKRFQSAQEMRAALEQFEASQGTQEPISTGTRIYTGPERTALYAAPKSPPAKKPAPVKAAQSPSPRTPGSSKKPIMYIGILLAVVAIGAMLFSFMGNGGTEDGGVDGSDTPSIASHSLNLPETGVENAPTDSIAIPLPATDVPQESTTPGAINTAPGSSGNTVSSQPAQSQVDAPSPPAATVRRSVLVQSSPSRAQVFLEGKRLGLTPFRIENLEARPYRLALSQTGFETWEGTINPQSQREVDVALSRLQGTVKIIVRPYGDIFIDGTSRAKETNAAVEANLDAGSHTISATHPVLGKWDKQVQITPGATQDVVFNFNMKIDVTIISDPVNAEIFVDGTSTSRYTPSQIKLSPGNHTIAVQKPGYTAVDGAKNIIIEKELSSPIAFKLDKNQ